MRTDVQQPQSIVIVTGSGGTLGSALLEQTLPEHGTGFGLQRHFSVAARGPGKRLLCDISDMSATAEIIRTAVLPASRATAHVSLIHAVGPFKYEGYYAATTQTPIDPVIMKMNCEVFKSMTGAVIEAVQHLHCGDTPVQINLCTFGSISEDYQVPLWHSFLEAKRRAQVFMQEQVEHYRLDQVVTLSALYVRTSTINTQSENTLRPHVPPEIKKYWLDPARVAGIVAAQLSALGAGEYKKIDIFDPCPAIHPAIYYRDIPALDRRWRAMMLG